MLEALIESGADERLVKLPWVANNLRWVMWKVVSLASGCKELSQQLLSYAVVLDELKKRYTSLRNALCSSPGDENKQKEQAMTHH